MNPNLELGDLIIDVVANWPNQDNDGLAVEIYAQIRDWMSRNQIVFYQP